MKNIIAARAFCLFSFLLICGCINGQQKSKEVIVSDIDLPITKDEIAYSYDTSLNSNFLFDYKQVENDIYDAKNHWDIKFSDKYFSVKIVYCDNNSVLFYCAMSGIMNGYRLFPQKHSDLVLVDRKTGQKKVDIKTKNGLLNATVKNSKIYLECYDPNVVRYYELNK